MPRANANWKRAKGRVSLLTPRQRTLLDLLEQDATNQQLADHFLVTLNQAKAEINEMLGRLELSNREELVEFWRWQRRAPAVPRWVTVVAAAGVALFLILGVAGVLVGGDGDAAPAAKMPSLGGALPTPIATAPPPLAALGLTPTAIPWPAAGPEGRLAFISPTGELMVKPMPSGAAAVIRNDEGHRTPAWSPSGKFLAFIESGHLVVSDEAGQLTALTQPGVDASWAWSPGADLLAYFSPEGMVLYDAAKRASRVIRGQGAPYPERPGGLYWSPAGTMILYGVYAGYTSPGRLDVTELRVFELRTGDDRLLLEESIPAKGGTSPLGWSGDGRWVFYREPPAFGNSAWVGSVDVHVMPAAGGASKTLGSTDGSPERFSTPQGPDVVAYVSGGFRFASDGGRRAMAVSNGEEQRIPGAPPGSVSALSYSSGGMALALIVLPEPPGGFGSAAEMQARLMGERLWVLLPGQPAKQLTDDPAYRDEHPVWSKDGKSILFTRIDAAGHASVWRISASGGVPELVQDGLGLGSNGVSGIYGWIEWSDLLAWWQP